MSEMLAQDGYGQIKLRNGRSSQKFYKSQLKSRLIFF